MGNSLYERFPVNFNQGFYVERAYLSKILKISSQEFSGTKENISSKTGIPTGKSSGKVEPHIMYAQAMGIISANCQKKTWTLSITDFGAIILEEDPHLTDNMSLWLLHLMLCNYKAGADVWFKLFAESSILLGNTFSQVNFYLYMKSKVSCDEPRRLNSLLKMYTNESSFGHINCLSIQHGIINRHSAVFNRDYFRGYASVMFFLWDQIYKDDRQILLDEFSRITFFFEILGWNINMLNTFLDALKGYGYISLDSQAGATLILRLKATPDILALTYNDLI